MADFPLDPKNLKGKKISEVDELQEINDELQVLVLDGNVPKKITIDKLQPEIPKESVLKELSFVFSSGDTIPHIIIPPSDGKLIFITHGVLFASVGRSSSSITFGYVGGDNIAFDNTATTENVVLTMYGERVRPILNRMTTLQNEISITNTGKGVQIVSTDLPLTGNEYIKGTIFYINF